MEKIPFKRINLGSAYEGVKPLFESGFIGLGEKVFEFERELAKYVGAKYCLATDSCTSALFLCLKWEYLNGTREVGIPSMTVPLVANSCLEAGLNIWFNGQTDWVGSAYLIEGTDIFDSAHELKKNQYKYGKLCFSFYPTKTIGSADGGAIATNDKEFITWARSAATYGRNQEAKYKNSWDYDIKMIGYKRHYTNLQAAICLEQLKRLDETNERRKKIRDTFNRAFSYFNVSDYLYRIDISSRDEFIEYANNLGIECGVHFKPLHLMTPFKGVQISIEDEIETNDAYLKTVSLPFFDTMTQEEIERVIEAVKNFK